MKRLALIACLLFSCGGSDPLPQSECYKALSNFYDLGCVVEYVSLSGAIEECKQLPDTQPCRDWVRCLTSMWPEDRCEICDRYLEACRNDLTP